MARFHINKNGEPGECRATRTCPFGEDAPHYESREAAYAAIEKENPLLPKLQKKVTVSEAFLENALTSPERLIENLDQLSTDELDIITNITLARESNHHRGKTLTRLLEVDNLSRGAEDKIVGSSEAVSAVLDYIKQEDGYGRTPNLTPLRASRLYMDSTDPSVLKEGIYSPYLTVEQKWELAGRYPEGYLDLAQEQGLFFSRKVHSSEFRAALYEKSLERISDPATSPKTADDYYILWSRGSSDTKEITAIFNAHQARTDWEIHPGIHTSLLDNDAVPRDIRKKAILQQAALNLPHFREFFYSASVSRAPGGWDERLPGKSLSDEQRAEFTFIRDRIDRKLSSSKTPASTRAEGTYLANLERRRAALEFALNEYDTYSPAAERKKVKKAERAFKRATRWDNGDPRAGFATSIRENKAAQDARQLAEMKSEIHRVIGFSNALAEQMR